MTESVPESPKRKRPRLVTIGVAGVFILLFVVIYFATQDLVTLSNHRKEKAQWPEFPDTQFAVDWHLRRDLDPGEELVLMFQSDGPPLVGDSKRFGILMQSPRKGTGTFRMSVHSLPFGNCTVFVEKRIGGRFGQSQRASNVIRFSSTASFFEP